MKKKKTHGGGHTPTMATITTGDTTMTTIITIGALLRRTTTTSVHWLCIVEKKTDLDQKVHAGGLKKGSTLKKAVQHSDYYFLTVIVACVGKYFNPPLSAAVSPV